MDNILQWAARASNARWHIILWTDAKLETGDWTKHGPPAGTVDIRQIEPMLHPELRNFYHKATKGPSPAFNMASDLARYSILMELGGVYADVDVGPGKVDLSKVPRMGPGDVPILAPSVRDRRALKEQLGEDVLKRSTSRLRYTLLPQRLISRTSSITISLSRNLALRFSTISFQTCDSALSKISKWEGATGPRTPLLSLDRRQ